MEQPQIIKFHTIKLPFKLGHIYQTTTLNPAYKMPKLRFSWKWTIKTQDGQALYIPNIADATLPYKRNIKD